MSDEELPENEDAKEGDDAPDLPPPSTFAGKARKAEEEGEKRAKRRTRGLTPTPPRKNRARCLTPTLPRKNRARGLAPTLPRQMSLPPTRCLTPKSTLVKRNRQTSL